MSNILFETTFSEELYKVDPHTTILLGTPWKELDEKEVELLTKILNSVKLSMAHVRVIESPDLDLSQWPDKPKKLIGFGVKTTGINRYEVIETPETRMIIADSLTTLMGNDDLKKALWTSLKQLFSI